MVLLYLVLLVAILVVNRYFFGMLIKPTDIFSVIWCTIAPLAQIGFYGYYPTSISTNVLTLFGKCDMLGSIDPCFGKLIVYSQNRGL